MSYEYWPPVMSIHRSDYATSKEYHKAYQDAASHYDYKARVFGGWMFFEQYDAYKTWRNQV